MNLNLIHESNFLRMNLIYEKHKSIKPYKY